MSLNSFPLDPGAARPLAPKAEPRELKELPALASKKISASSRKALSRALLLNDEALFCQLASREAGIDSAVFSDLFYPATNRTTDAFELAGMLGINLCFLALSHCDPLILRELALDRRPQVPLRIIERGALSYDALRVPLLNALLSRSHYSEDLRWHFCAEAGKQALRSFALSARLESACSPRALTPFQLNLGRHAKELLPFLEALPAEVISQLCVSERELTAALPRCASLLREALARAEARALRELTPGAIASPESIRAL